MIKKEYSKDDVESEAVFSDCERYRYSLSRTWDKNLPKIMFIGLNPSTADEVKNDPTVSRMISYAKKWNYGAVFVQNVFAFRATLPSDLKRADNPIGKETDKFILDCVKKTNKIIACWGNHGLFMDRGFRVRKLIDKMECFGLTKAGEPKHPLYLRKDANLVLLK